MVRQRPWLRAKQLGGVTVGATSLLWVRCLEHFHRSASILPYCTSASMAEADQTAVDPELNSTSASATTSASTVTTTGNDSDDCPVAFLETPEGRRIAYCKRDGSQPGIVFVHGIGSVMQGNKVTALDDYCRTKGVSFVRFDLSGHGQSSERFKETNVSIWLEDLTAVMELLTTGPQLLVGSSLGGWLVFLYTMRNPERVAGLVGIATAVDFTQRLWKGLDKTTREEVKRSGVYHMDSPYIPDLEITMDFIMDGEKHGILDVPGTVTSRCLSPPLISLSFSLSPS